jgi:hypothetical protein
VPDSTGAGVGLGDGFAAAGLGRGLGVAGDGLLGGGVGAAGGAARPNPTLARMDPKTRDPRTVLMAGLLAATLVPVSAPMGRF